MGDEDATAETDENMCRMQKEQEKQVLGIQTACVRMAKGRHRSLRNGYAKNVKTHMLNGIVRFSAEEGAFGKAEHWMEKLDVQRGIPAEVRTFNMLILSAARLKEFDKAEEWFARCKAPALHPELVGLKPSPESYNTMIQMFTRAGDVTRAEKWVDKIWNEANVRATLASQISLIRACLDAGDFRRGHKWCEELVRKGCSKKPNYDADMVFKERIARKLDKEWDSESLVAMVCDLIQALAKIGNFNMVSRWLRYLVDCGVKPEDAPVTWTAVRQVYPRDIIPAVLSGESDHPVGVLPVPPRTQPAIQPGEDVQKKRSLRDGPELIVGEAPLAISRPGTQMSCRSPALRLGSSTPMRSGRSPMMQSSTPRRSAGSPSLSKFLEARSLGATPSLAWARPESRNEVRSGASRAAAIDAAAGVGQPVLAT
mmetsp:Transcript_9273/g.15399  ORF Transcript_9273/g.15399 Transcript_9273/m.15399 type:complete len:426 (-) Transcript_9273:42-1319(-)